MCIQKAFLEARSLPALLALLLAIPHAVASQQPMASQALDQQEEALDAQPAYLEDKDQEDDDQAGSYLEEGDDGEEEKSSSPL